ncbi:conserved protein of unknown function [Bradyrhizobium sp. ORS 285]|uniref:hypothetical protein n=1 Tax=Bradyrhizobium sp. ORS 285 TaxID=115808 RepID=UPI0002407F18|nr:hypothetical protein [Bradyrhizobium sp. ORS 285]CCD89097.1 conserved hypothetical protein [Bradyrhizobium sp. ORS 285]SMX57331.1 conserved protein of unknown function [Bradyrhizobium sp. ORS 285]
MSEVKTICLTRSIILAAARHAERDGLSVEDYVMRVFLREMELDIRAPAILVHDAAEAGAGFALDREQGESEEAFESRKAMLGLLFS